MVVNHQIILEYLKVLLSWPVVVFVLGIILFFKFSSSIKIFLENLRSFKAGPIEFSQQQREEERTEEKIKKELREEKGIKLSLSEIKKIQTKIETLSKEKRDKEHKISEQERLIDELFKISHDLLKLNNVLIKDVEFYEFSYLNLYLVDNSKQALWWFYQNPSTKENFINSFFLPPQIVNQIAEKEAIFNALLVNDLIKKQNEFYVISEKGKKFLKFLGYSVKM